MAKVEKHPTQKDKYQCTECSYGHENGVSRQSVYKHYKKAHTGPITIEIEESEQEPEPEFFELPGAQEIEESDDFDDWDSVSWLESDEKVNVTPHTIPDPIRRMASKNEGKELLIAHRTMTKSMIRWSFLGADRGITWWGKGVTNNPNYELKRSKEDYDVLQNSTMTMLDAYGIQIPSSPLLVWSTIVGSAYVPALVDTQSKADPSKRGLFRAMLTRLPFIGKRIRKKQKAEQGLVRREER
jgi:hypothetical protein